MKMPKKFTIKYYSLAFYILLLLAEMVSCAPCYSNYENCDEPENFKSQEYHIKNKSLVLICESSEIKPLEMPATDTAGQTFDRGPPKDVPELYELLLKKQALDDQLHQSHQIIRKSNRSPSLRLRFGKRNPYDLNSNYVGHPYQIFEDVNK